MVNIPGDKPFVPPITPKEIKQSKPAEEAPKTSKPLPSGAPTSGRGINEYDSQAIAVRLAAYAHKAKEEELNFEKIIQRVIDMTGLTNPESAMEEINRRLQKEIEETIDAIKSNKDLMEEAEAWQNFAELLESKLSSDQVEAFFGIIKETIKLMASK